MRTPFLPSISIDNNVNRDFKITRHIMMHTITIILMFTFLYLNAMESTSSDPALAPQVTSFLSSFMAGKCYADSQGIEFGDYRDEALRYRFSFEMANILMQYCQNSSKNPLEDITDCEPEVSFKKRSELLCDRLRNLSLEQLKMVQIFLVHEHLITLPLKSEDPFKSSLNALRFGDIKRFNRMMQYIKIQSASENILITIEKLIEKIKKTSGT